MRKETIRKLAEEYSQEHIEGEPLTIEVVIEYLVEFAKAIEQTNQYFRL